MYVPALTASLFVAAGLVWSGNTTGSAPEPGRAAPVVRALDIGKLMDSSRFVRKLEDDLSREAGLQELKLKELVTKLRRVEGAQELLERGSIEFQEKNLEGQMLKFEITQKRKLIIAQGQHQISEMTHFIFSQIEGIVVELSQKQGIDLVLKRLTYSKKDQRAGVRSRLKAFEQSPFLYANKDFDITDKVMELLDARVPADASGGGTGQKEPKDAPAGATDKGKGKG